MAYNHPVFHHPIYEARDAAMRDFNRHFFPDAQADDTTAFGIGECGQFIAAAAHTAVFCKTGARSRWTFLFFYNGSCVTEKVAHAIAA